MKTEKGILPKRILASIVTLVMVLLMLPVTAMPVKADTPSSVSAQFRDRPINYSIDYGNGHKSESYNGNYGEKTAVSGDTRYTAYCIEPGEDLNTGDSFSSADSLSGSSMYSLAARVRAANAMRAGYKSGAWDDSTGGARDMATQILVWNALFDVSASKEASILSHLESTGSFGKKVVKYYNTYKAKYDTLDSSVKTSKIPSFMADTSGSATTYELDYDPVKGDYFIVLEDTNKVLKNFDFSGESGVTFTKSGNKLTIRSTKRSGFGTIKATNPNATKTYKGSVKFWHSGSHQDIITYDSSTNDVLKLSKDAYLKLKLGTGDVEIAKTSEDAEVEGLSFNISGPDGFSKNVVTGKDGKINTTGIKVGQYTVKEINIPDRYREPAAQTVNVLKNKKATVSFENIVKKGHVELTKYAQPDDSKDTPANSNGIMNPLKGAEFTATCTDYAKNKDKIKDYDKLFTRTLTTDENGFVRFEDLWFGTWTITETKTPAGYKPIIPITVTIGKDDDGKTFQYSLLDSFDEQKVKIIKIDERTGKSILQAGTTFKVKDLDTGKFINQTVNYPTPTTYEEFLTNNEGYLVLPEVLRENKNGYELHEVKAPYGYAINTTPVHFVVDSTKLVQDGKEQYIKIEMKDKEQMATISVEKSGEVFTNVTTTASEHGDVHQPVYEIKGQPNAVYQITAAEEILSADGHKDVVHKKGAKVDEITTDANGKATSKELHLGKYEVVEKTAPDGYVVDKTPIEIELEYKGQNVTVYDVPNQCFNERQKLDLNFTKEMETSEYNLKSGKQDEYKNVVFGIFAKDEVKSQGGASIPADGLVELVKINQDMKAEVTTDFPVLTNESKYYVKEMETDNKYLLTDEVFDFTVKYQGQDKKKISIDLNKGKAILNKLKIGGTEISKEDVVDGTPLPDTGIEILDEDKNVIIQGRTDEDGKFKFEELPVGDYYFREYDAPNGYVIDETPFPFSVKDHGEIVKCVMTNKKADATPKTGDSFVPVAIAGGVLLLAAAGLVVVMVLKKKRAK